MTLLAARPRLALLLALALPPLAVAAVPAAASAEEAASTGCGPATMATMATSEPEALALATRCKREVEVASAATDKGGVFATPAGEMVFRSGVSPYRARTASGAWAPVDTTLVRRADGSIGPVNTVVPVAVSPGGDAPFAAVTMSGRSFGLTWPGRLPEPVLSGETATYRDVLPEVDLVVRALPEGYRHDVVVRSARAAADPRLARIRLGVRGDGLSVLAGDDGAMRVVDASGEEIATSLPPVMWDSPRASQASRRQAAAFADVAEPVTARTSGVGVETSAGAITLVPDPALLTGPATSYPVVIDPVWTGGKRSGEWGSVWSKYPTQIAWKGGSPALGNGSTYGDAGAGQTCDGWSGLNCTTSPYRIRSFFRMNTEDVTRNDAREVVSAKFKILQRHAASCSAGKARVWHTNIITSSNSWNSQPTWRDQWANSTQNADNGASCGGPGYVEFPVTDMAKTAKDGKWASMTIGMKAVNESPSPALAEWRRYDSSTATLEIVFNTLPKPPTGLATNGVACTTTAPGPWLTTVAPSFTASPQDSDGGTVSTVFQILGADSTVLREWAVPGASGKPITTTAPPGSIPATGSYSWRAKTQDERTSSAFAARCYFQVDTHAPSTPGAALLTTDPVLGQAVSFTLTGASDTTLFRYALNGGTPATITAANGTATLVITPPATSTDHVLQIWAGDAAGNESARSDFPFRTRLPAETGWWPLAGSGEDTAGTNPATTPASPVWVADTFGTAGSALQFDGGTCVTAARPAADTARSFTVSAWVKVPAGDPGTATMTVLSQSGGARAAFDLRRTSANKWAFGLHAADNATSAESVATTASTVPAGTWQHLTAVQDLLAGTLSLYADGVLQGTAAVPATHWQAVNPLVIGCRGTASPFTGAVHDVRVFDGAVTPEQAGAIAAAPAAFWSLNTTGTEAVGGNDLTFHGTHDWVDDHDELPGLAYGLALGGGGYATSARSAVRTDKAFTVAAWVKLSDLTADRTVLSQAAANGPSFTLRYRSGLSRWEFAMASDGTTAPAWTGVTSTWAPEAGAWYQLTAVHDPARHELRLYVNGTLQGTAPSPATPWHADGSVLVGAAPGPSGLLVGAVDEVRAYSGVLDDRRIARLACGGSTSC
ncbi:LamG-like jellyroll fold domain-containing protein [Longispora albida]|uniref:LamG-like jellyroll fold domain-containing protein n=1 Tax=Longispora albida TaxID=203523 RepID=UPI00039B3E6F|nr:LamG-like jellyroll fold domain-containing protein [Longispora albida]